MYKKLILCVSLLGTVYVLAVDDTIKKEAFQSIFTHKTQQLENCLKNLSPDAQDEEGNTLLCCAVKQQNVSAVQALLRWSANPNKPSGFYKDTPLESAIIHENCDIFNALMSHDVDVNQTTGAGAAPLHTAVIFNKNKFIQPLLDKRAAVNALMAGRTPLDIAENPWNRNKEAARILKKNRGTRQALYNVTENRRKRQKRV